MTDIVQLDEYTFGKKQTCFGCGPHNPVGLRLRFDKHGGDKVVTRFVLGEGYDGPPGILHGGLQALVADELAGWTLVGLRGRIGLTTSLNVRYIRSLRLGQQVVGEGTISAEQAQSATVRVVLKQNGQIGCVARVCFILADGDKMEEILERGLPPGWRKFFDGVDDGTPVD
ncbi:MAG: hypothetical protein CSA66_05360 [Proteobacteria bacterium]|nr:MAG: hypothetical protein CSA66_05360 [Pseudomonadota bacterium]